MTLEYKVPVRDMEFLYFELLNGKGLADLEGFGEADEDTVKAILEEAAKIIETDILPLNEPGDQQGCRLEGTEVILPDGFKEAYTKYIDGGWTALTAPAQYGGMNLPYSVGYMIGEMMCSANQSFSMYPGLTHGAAKVIEIFGSEAMKNTYLPKFSEGTWSGTMCLTEAQCGTDLGLIQTKAEPLDDGAYELTGTKIFITSGEHQLTENIVHLVLARLPDAPPGIKGISLFVVPKFLSDDGGNITDRNPITCGAIEHKMGIKASSTCVMNLDQAKGYLIGQPHKGMQGMFVMMNSARLGTGTQGFAAGERAYQGALAYAQDRLQMRALTGAKFPQQKADPIIVHPDVRRMLLTIKAYTEGCRAMSYWIAQELDIAENHADEERRQEAEDLAALLTPVIKAFNTDTGYESTNLGVQIFGGHGYISEHGMEQLVRDTRIAQLYEGTNGIQSMDLIGRKLPMHNGRLMMRFLTRVDAFVKENMEMQDAERYIKPLAYAVDILKDTTNWVAEAAKEDPNHIGAAAVDYLQMFGLVTVAYMWAEMALVAQQKDPEQQDDFYRAKCETASFYMAKLLPKVQSLMLTVMTGADSLMNYPDECF